MDHWWVRCGNCFTFSSPLTYTFVCLTSCGHFVCNHCLRKSPLPKPASTGYCYDCKKPCSIVNLSQGDKLNPDIAFYFKDPVCLFQKIIEIENFQKLHRNRRVESIVKKRYIDDIIKVRLLRERVDKYLPYLRQIYSTLCTKYGIKPTNQVNYNEAEINAFVDELVAVQRQLQFQQTPNAMDVDARASSHSSKSTPMVQGSPAWSIRSGVGGARGTPGSMFRAHVQNEMRGDSAPMSVRRTTPIGGQASTGRVTPKSGGRVTPVGLQRRPATTPPGGRGRVTPTGSQYGVRITPTGSQYGVRVTPTGSQYSGRVTPTSANRNKPSPLLSSSRAISTQAFSPQVHGISRAVGQTHTPPQCLQPHPQPHPYGASLLRPNSLQLPASSSATPTHAQIRQAMLSSGPQAGHVERQPRAGIPMSASVSSND